MNQQPIPATRPGAGDRPALPASLIALVLLLIVTHASSLLMNEPAAYWLRPQYASAAQPFGSLLQAGPWPFLGVATLYLLAVGLLLRRLPARAGISVAAALVLLHSVALYSTATCGFRPLYESHSATACEAYKDAPVILFATLFILALLVQRLPGRLEGWGRRLLIPLAVLWAVIMGYGVVRAALPPASPWKPLAPAHSPGPRTMAAIAYDTRRQRAVLFGGITLWDGHQWVYDNSTWEWDGQDWQKMDTPVAPTGRILHAMAYDEERGKVMLFGGENTSGVLGDLWEWDGKTWHRLCPVCNPAARTLHKMFFDPVRRQIVLYGGQNGETGYAEAWTWDGQKWANFTFENSAPAVYNAPMVYDTGRHRALTFMGNTWGGTWAWEDATWRKLQPAGQPPLRDEAVLVYDPVRDHSVLFGGIREGKSLFNDTWILDGDTWTKLDTPAAPPLRYRAAAFYDPLRDSVILYSGDHASSSNYGDMWELVLPEGDQR